HAGTLPVALLGRSRRPAATDRSDDLGHVGNGGAGVLRSVDGAEREIVLARHADRVDESGQMDTTAVPILSRELLHDSNRFLDGRYPTAAASLPAAPGKFEGFRQDLRHGSPQDNPNALHPALNPIAP